MWKTDSYDFILLFIILSYVMICPYTKVEESFNMQALYDLHHFNIFHQLTAFDHLQFPGVVPRTFVGSFILFLIGYPLYTILSKLFHLYHDFVNGEDHNGIITYEGIYTQMFYRSLLAIFAWMAIVHFKHSLAKLFGGSSKRIQELFSMGLLLQFHLNFYVSRTLPNVFAFILVMHAFAYWLSKRALLSILIIGVAMTIFRCDMLVLLAPIVLSMLLMQEITFFKSLISGVVVCLLSVGVTVLIDSYFWRRWLWPEGIVLFFNTVENRSSEWGTMPFHWYFSNALLKSLNMLWIWIIAGSLGIRYNHRSSSSSYWNILAYLKIFHYSSNQKKAFYYLIPVAVFIILYSLLPHKELRFIFPALPIFTLFSAVSLNELLPRKSNELWFPLSLLSDDTQNNIDEEYNENVKLAKKNENEGRNKKETKSSRRSIYQHLISLALVLAFSIMFLLTNLFLMASNHNYPGAVALDRLIQQHIGMQISMLDSNMDLITRPIFVHIDVLAATTGITRFVQTRLLFQSQSNYRLPELDYLFLNSSPEEWTAYMNSLVQVNETGTSATTMLNQNWVTIGKDLVYYSKHENLTSFDSFDWLITENSTFIAKNPRFSIVEKIQGFDRFQFSLKTGLRLQLKPILYLVRNQRTQENF